jgi:carnitine O-acetyltransferase
MSSGTFGKQDGLPRLPLPAVEDVEDSCERFIEWCSPLLTTDELSATRTATAAFLGAGGPAHKLQTALEQYNASGGVHSWLDTFWRDRYLGRRDRIALNANYFFLFRHSGEEQVECAAGLLAAAVNYKVQLDAQRIPPTDRRGQALSMEQHKFLFSATRIPGLARDTVRAPYSPGWPGPSRERHIVVFFRGNLFRMDVIGPRGNPHTVDELAAGLRAVMAAGAAEAAPGTAVGHLTTKARAEWAVSRRTLVTCHPRNARMLNAVETALFCLCLEDTAPTGPQEACEHLLHGDSRNRWFDKALSLISFRDGTAGINVEHSCLDGNTIVNFADALLSRTAAQHSRQSGARRQGVPAIGRVEFVIDVGLLADVLAAGASFASQAAHTATSVLWIEEFGADRAKQLRISPDAFVQMAFQLAHKRTRGHIGSTYESVAIQQYHHGRTEAMRVVTPAAVRFVAAMDDPEAGQRVCRTAFRVAAERHVARAAQCRAGNAPEQHLWELQLIQRRRGAALGVPKPPALFASPGWLKMREDYLSTSSTSCSPNILYGGFGPTSSRCIGIGYMVLPGRLRLHLSTSRPGSDEMALFADKLKEVVRELQDLLAGGHQAD